MDEEQQRIRGYLQAKAAEYSTEELIARVEEGLAELLAAARAITPAAFGTAAAEGEWTPAECLDHVARACSVNATEVLHVALTGELPAAWEPEIAEGQEALCEHLRGTFDSLYAHIREASPLAFLEVRWPHPFFGELNWREWTLFLRIHCKDHARQVAEMTAGS